MSNLGISSPMDWITGNFKNASYLVTGGFFPSGGQNGFSGVPLIATATLVITILIILTAIGISVSIPHGMDDGSSFINSTVANNSGANMLYLSKQSMPVSAYVGGLQGMAAAPSNAGLTAFGGSIPASHLLSLAQSS